MTERETLKAIREGILSGKCSDGNLAWIVNLCDESLAESGSASAGNAAAMCKALKYIVSLLHSDTFVVLNPPGMEIIAKILLASEAALSEPPRQCDVGTDEEQAQRFNKLCLSHTIPWHGCSDYCPLLKSDRCALKWAQMPYSESNGVK